MPAFGWGASNPRLQAAARTAVGVQLSTKTSAPAAQPMNSSHSASTKPTPVVALIALGVVHRFEPAWLATSVTEAARDHLSAERLSRLVTRALPHLESLVAGLTRRGRPPRDDASAALKQELALTGALLGIATSILAHVSLRRPALRALIVGAWHRLRATHAVSQKRFTDALSLSPRTFRSWLFASARTTPSPHASPLEPTPAPKPPRPRPPRRKRFGFDVLLPDTQLGADTTDLTCFGVPLKLVAAQDIGGRDTNLFEAILVDDAESSDHVIRVFTAALADKPGAQMITDQGSPYLAHATRALLETLEVEHAPQKEADPRGKATVERAFLTVKSIAAPLLGLTDRLSAAVPSLRNPILARAAARLVLVALLRAYQHGARAARTALSARGSIDPDDLARLASESRERARAEERSIRLWLEQFHALYDIKRPLAKFVAAFRRFPLAVLREAERGFQSQAHRIDIKDRASYFAAIARRRMDEYRARRARERKEAEADRERNLNCDKATSQRASWCRDPVAGLNTAFRMLAAQWLPERGVLLAAGAGLGRACLREVLQNLVPLHGTDGAADIARAVLDSFARTDGAQLGRGNGALRSLLEAVLSEVGAAADHNLDVASTGRGRIPWPTGEKQRPPPDEPLRI